MLNDRYKGFTLDEIAEKSGGYLAPMFNRNMETDYHAMSLYCKKKGIKSKDLTDDEYDSFLFEKKGDSLWE